MSRMQRAAVLLSLLGHLRSAKSWCGETHIQKTTYFLQELFEVPLSFEFILYKHGPFSFDLNNEITALRADYLVTVQSRPPYGPSILPSQEGESLVARYPKTCALFERRMRFVAEELGPRDVTDLEKLATALFVTREPSAPANSGARARRIHNLKPHVSLEEARQALQQVDELVAKAGDLKN